MKKYQSISKEELTKKKLDLIHKSYLFAFAVFFFGGTLSILFSTWDTNRKIYLILTLGSVSILFFLLTMLNKRFIKKPDFRYNIYLLTILIYIVFISLSVADKYLSTVSQALGVFALMIFISFKRSHVFFYVTTVFALVVYFFIKNSQPTVELGYGYYINFFIVMLIISYVVIKAMNLLGV